jgi:hypothetical protein
MQFVPTDTSLTINTDPVNMTLNTAVDPEAFELGLHKNAEICKMEPAALAGSQ